jgi:hypothetical protein
MNRQFLATLTLAWLMLHMAGCALPGPLRFSKNDFPKTGPKNPVVRILGLWQASEGMWEGKTTRGFSGQVMFFGQNDDAPAQVDGDVMVYVFDDLGEPEEQAKPIHQFNYPSATWKAMLNGGPLGATYYVFIPYTRPGIHEANCTLRVRYIPASGHPIPVYSEMVNISLAGTKKRKSDNPRANDDDLPGGLPSSDSGTSNSNPNEVSDRMPPHAHGISEPVPAQHDLQKLMARKPKAVELTEAEQQRILQETRARLATGDDARVSLIGYEDSDPEQPAARKRRSSRKSRNPLRSTDVAEDEVDDNHAATAVGSPVTSSALRTIDDEGEENPPAKQGLHSAERKSRRTTINLDSDDDGPGKRHPLED